MTAHPHPPHTARLIHMRESPLHDLAPAALQAATPPPADTPAVCVVAVGNRVAPVPPLRSRTCALTHTAPTLGVQHRWLCSVLRGHYRYCGLPSNWDPVNGFYQELCRSWYRALRRRSQRRLTWPRFQLLLERFPLPPPTITHPRPARA